MQHKTKRILIRCILPICLALLIGSAYYGWTQFAGCCEPSVPIANEQATSGEDSDAIEETTSIASEIEIKTKQFTTDELNVSVLPMDFDLTIPQEWQVEYIPEALAINFYDPSADGSSSLEQSQIFVKYFEASRFLTLSTVTIHSQENLTINERSTVRYDIQKKSGVANFANQPTWRSSRHYVTDIKSSDASPTLFYVFGQNPDLDDVTFFDVLDSVGFN